MNADWMAPAMFAGMVFILLLGYPVAFSLGALGLLAGAFAMLQGMFPPEFLRTLPLRVFGILSNELLLAIPFFTLMGAILDRCGLAEDMLEGAGQLFGSLPGGLAYAVIIVGAILGAVTGTVAASVIAMGVISLPIMTRYRYNMQVATGVIAASGTITQLIPPALVLVVLADQLGRSVGDMYLGAIGPSAVQILLFLLFIWILSVLRPGHMPPIPEAERVQPGWPLLRRILLGMLPSLALIFIVLGTIFLGLATPTESGAMGALGAMGLAALRGRLSGLLVCDALDATVRLTAMAIYILIGSTIFTVVFAGVDGHHWIEKLLANLPGGQVGFLLFACAFIFFVAFFLDFFEIAFIIIPLLAPVAKSLGIDLVWFGVLICVVMQTSFMHPPFGFALFYLRGIAPPEVRSRDIYLGAIPWVGLQLLMALIIIFWPSLVTRWLEKPIQVDYEKVHIIVPPRE